MRIKVFGASAIATIGSLFLFGCAATPTKYQIKTSGDPVINRDTTGKPLSVVVRLYQLKDSAEFSKLTFATAASGRSDAELLGADLVDRSETVVVPGVQRVDAGTLATDTKYVGIVGYFRRPDRHFWRYLVKADDVRRNGLTFTVKDCYIELSGIKPVLLPSQPANAKPECIDPNAPVVTGSDGVPVQSSATNSGRSKAKKRLHKHKAAPAAF